MLLMTLKSDSVFGSLWNFVVNALGDDLGVYLILLLSFIYNVVRTSKIYGAFTCHQELNGGPAEDCVILASRFRRLCHYWNYIISKTRFRAIEGVSSHRHALEPIEPIAAIDLHSTGQNKGLL